MSKPNLAEVAAPIVQALEVQFGALAANEKDTVEKFVDTIADENLNRAVTAIAEHIDAHGLAGIANAPVRNALIGAEPSLDGIVNDDIDGAYTAFEALVARLASKSP